MLDELSHSYVLYCQSHRFEESHLILCEYKEPDPELRNSALKAFIAIANNTAGIDKPKAIRMLNHALSIANLDIRKQVVARLNNLGVEVSGDGGK